jgi:uncharacterized repeat protein (TIGR03803 family)
MSALQRRCSRIFRVLLLAMNVLSSILLLTVASVAQTASPPTFSLLYQFKSGRDGSSPYSNLILDPQGNLYGTTLIDGAYSYGTVFKVTPAGKETVLHSFTGTGGDGAHPVAPLIRDAAGNVYGTTEYGASTVHVVRTAVEPYSKSIQPAKRPCCIASPESLVSTG